MKKTAFLILLLASSQAFAQSVNSHLFRFSDTLETFQVEDALGPESELYPHRFLLRISYDYINTPLIRLDADRNTTTGVVVNDIHTLAFGGGVMLSDRVFVGVTVPFHYSDINGQEVSATDTEAWELGDIQWKLKWRLSGDDRDVNFAVMPWGFIPTGRNDQDNNYLISDDSWGLGGMLLADATFFDRLNIYGNAGMSWADNAEFASIDRRVRIDTGVGGFLALTDWLGVNAEMINSFTVSSFAEDQNPIQIQFGLRGRLGPVRAFAGTGLEALREARSGNGSFQGGVKVAFGNRKQEEEPPVEPQPDPEPEPTVTEKIEILKDNLSVRREVNFETAKANILPESHDALNSAAEIILQYADYIKLIIIEGHTDSRGSESYNQKLSEERAASVKQYLVEQGVPEEKLKSVGYGESRLKVEETSPETLLMNRRVEFIVDQTIETEQKYEVIEYPDGTTEEKRIDTSVDVKE